MNFMYVFCGTKQARKAEKEREGKERNSVGKLGNWKVAWDGEFNHCCLLDWPTNWIGMIEIFDSII